MNSLFAETRKISLPLRKPGESRLKYVENLVALLTHSYIHLGMAQEQAYRSALIDFEEEYPEEIQQLRAS